jgi:hypothetical protein
MIDYKFSKNHFILSALFETLDTGVCAVDWFGMEQPSPFAEQFYLEGYL